MAIYHCSVKMIGRNAGRSSVAAAAYRAGERLVNEYDGVEHDFTKKHWIEYQEILLPKHAPKEYADRGTLWNAVELSEKSSSAQLAREFELALPVEFTREQQIEVLHRFIEDQLVSQGMIADLVIHNPPITNDRHQPIDRDGTVVKEREKMQFCNPHAHIMVTVRPMDEHGKWQKKTEIEYLCMRNGEERGFTSEEYKQAKMQGWEKQYRYYKGKQKVWMTASEGRENGLERVNRNPKTSPYGRKNAITEYWNHKDRIFEWRAYWETVINDKFQELHSDIRIDSRSFVRQGRSDELPTLHMGTSAWNMEKRADREIREGKSEAEVIRSDIGEINREIRDYNCFVRELKATMYNLLANQTQSGESTARDLEAIRSQLIINRYQRNILYQKLDHIYGHIQSQEHLLEQIHKLASVGQDTSVTDYLTSIMARAGLHDISDIHRADQELATMQHHYQQMTEKMEYMDAIHDKLLGDYRTYIHPTAPSELSELLTWQEELRPQTEQEVREQVCLTQDFDPDLLSDAMSMADWELHQITKLLSNAVHRARKQEQLNRSKQRR